ncbi:MAG: Calx-beta domain-containing protein [Phycisphaerales bacterium]
MTINDNEATVALTTNDAQAAEVTTGTANGGRYTFTRSLASNAQALVVHFTITGTATALAGADFTLSSGATLVFDDTTGEGTITIPAGSNTAVLNVNVVDDATAENAETVVLTVNAGDGYRLATAAAQRVGTVTIADNEPTVTVAGRDVAAAEVFTGTANPAVFRITRTGATTNPLVVTYALTGTATAGDDYTVLSTTTVTIPAGSLFVDVTINVVDDGIVEGNENVTLTLVADTTYRLSATTSQRAATAVISDNEPTFGVTAPDANAAEGNTNTGTFRIARTGGNSQITVVHFSITGTADPLNDFVLSSSTPGASLTFDTASGLGTITFTGSTTFATITLTANTDATTEGSETAIITLLHADDGDQDYTISGTQTSATINIANTPVAP